MNQPELLKTKKLKPKKTVFVDGGATYGWEQKGWTKGYITIVDETGVVVHHDPNLGEINNIVAEYESIKWAVENISARPLKVVNDCMAALAWARKGDSTGEYTPLNLDGVILEHQTHNLADVHNALNVSPKFIAGAKRSQLRKLIIFEFGEACYVANGDKIEGDYNVDESAEAVVEAYFAKPKV